MFNRFRSSLYSICLAVCFLSGAAARAEGTVLPPCEAYNPAAEALNPDGDPALRQASLERLIADSRGGDSASRYQLGNLYRLGRAHPAGLVDRDLAKARPLLSNAALDGHVRAMAGMAEIELARGEPMSAMIWAQAFNYYFERQTAGQGGNKAYLADLLDRIYERLGRSKEIEREIEEYLASFILTHGSKLDAKHEALRDGKVQAKCRSVNVDWPTNRLADEKVRMRNTRNTRDMHSPGLAVFRLQINPAGEVVHAFVLDSLPDAAAALGLMDTVLRMRFNAVDASAPQRSILVPVSFDDHSVRLRD